MYTWSILKFHFTWHEPWRKPLPFRQVTAFRARRHFARHCLVKALSCLKVVIRLPRQKNWPTCALTFHGKRRIISLLAKLKPGYKKLALAIWREQRNRFVPSRATQARRLSSFY